MKNVSLFVYPLFILFKISFVVLISLQDRIGALDARVEAFENQMKEGHVLPTHSIDIKGNPNQSVEREEKVKKDDDDDVDLFGSDSEEESETAAKVREERLAAYNAKKSKSISIITLSRKQILIYFFLEPALIAKSNIILDVKPWDDETDMVAMEAAVRKIEMDGLLWGAAKLVPLAYGIHKLQISCVVEDDKVSIDLLQEQIEALEDFVQSIDIAAFNKV